MCHGLKWLNGTMTLNVQSPFSRHLGSCSLLHLLQILCVCLENIYYPVEGLDDWGFKLGATSGTPRSMVAILGHFTLIREEKFSWLHLQILQGMSDRNNLLGCYVHSLCEMWYLYVKAKLSASIKSHEFGDIAPLAPLDPLLQITFIYSL